MRKCIKVKRQISLFEGICRQAEWPECKRKKGFKKGIPFLAGFQRVRQKTLWASPGEGRKEIERKRILTLSRNKTRYEQDEEAKLHQKKI